MSYTLWRGDVQVGFTVGEVTREPSGTLSAGMQTLAAYTLPSGFSQWTTGDSDSRTIDLIIDSPASATQRERPEPRLAHPDTDRNAYVVREYTGPVEHPTPATAFVLRDPEGLPLDMGMLCLHDLRSLFALIAPEQEAPIPFFSLTAVSSDLLEVEPPAS